MIIRVIVIIYHLEWDQTFDAVYDASCMLNAKFHIGHLTPGVPDMVDCIIKPALIHPDTKFSDLYQEIAGSIKLMDGRELTTDCSTLIFALRDNGSTLTE